MDLTEMTTALAADADAHDKVCTDTCDCTDHVCMDYRYFVVALVMNALGVDLTDIGYVADKLIFIGESQPCGEEVWPTTIGDERGN